MDVSDHWRLLFYVNLGTAAYAILQIIVASCAFQRKTGRSICDRLLLPITMIHLTLSMGAFIWCHVARFSHSGMVCSGDYLDENQFQAVKAFQTHQIAPD